MSTSDFKDMCGETIVEAEKFIAEWMVGEKLLWKDIPMYHQDFYHLSVVIEVLGKLGPSQRKEYNDTLIRLVNKDATNLDAPVCMFRAINASCLYRLCAAFKVLKEQGPRNE